MSIALLDNQFYTFIYLNKTTSASLNTHTAKYQPYLHHFAIRLQLCCKLKEVKSMNKSHSLRIILICKYVKAD